MDGFWVFLALAGVVFVFLGPIGFFLTISARGRLQIAALPVRRQSLWGPLADKNNRA
jgi:hypothetical protein